MMTEKNAKLWKGLGAATIMLCLPIGIYGWLQGLKLWRSFKIGDYKTSEKCKKNIKYSWIAIGILWVLLIIIAIATS